MPFKENNEGQTHYYNDGCKEHSDDLPTLNMKIARKKVLIQRLQDDIHLFGPAGDDLERLESKRKEVEHLESLRDSLLGEKA